MRFPRQTAPASAPAYGRFVTDNAEFMSCVCVHMQFSKQTATRRGERRRYLFLINSVVFENAEYCRAYPPYTNNTHNLVESEYLQETIRNYIPSWVVGASGPSGDGGIVCYCTDCPIAHSAWIHSLEFRSEHSTSLTIFEGLFFVWLRNVCISAVIIY